MALQDTDRPHWHHFCLPILHHISEFKCMLFRKHWGCWPPLPRSLPALHLFFLGDLLLYILLGTLHHVQQTDSVTESCCSSFVWATKRLQRDRELTCQRWPPGRSCQMIQGDSRAPEVCRARWECSCSKKKEDVTQMRFIHLNIVDHQTDVAAEALVRQSKKRRRQTERRKGADRATGKASQL